ncbi:putative signal transducing protein [Rubinisphaera margarita]|uniref:putative signal transducing protein n=1 Tax=Rubinisphaera margarita TaxID=2909586 RepID=UPI001EE80EA5|nr:DUF2007 domain-containing protein [Rubinisphaera margarita]MCG6155497.1 DUF2007 domain-containing protein [Rubinisphaera margarita]
MSFERVASFDNANDARIAAIVLQQEGIQSRIENEDSFSLVGAAALLPSSLPQVHLHVADEFVSHAKEVLKSGRLAAAVDHPGSESSRDAEVVQSLFRRVAWHSVFGMFAFPLALAALWQIRKLTSYSSGFSGRDWIRFLVLLLFASFSVFVSLALTTVLLIEADEVKKLLFPRPMNYYPSY